MSIATEIQRLQTAKADIKSAIENKGVTVGNGTIDTYAEKIGLIETGGGGTDGVSIFEVLRSMTSVAGININHLGASDVVLNLDNVTTLRQFFLRQEDAISQNITVEKLTINCQQPISSLYQFCYASVNFNDNKLKRMTLNIDYAGNTFGGAFGYLSALEIIDGNPLDFSTVTSVTQLANTFLYCNSLKEVRFVANSIPMTLSFQQSSLLSDESIQSIIDGLVDLTGQTTQTITFHLTVGNKLTDSQKATITAKNWTLAY